MVKQPKNTLKNSKTWIIRKSNQTVSLLVPKEFLIAVFIFFNLTYRDDEELFILISYEIDHYYIIKSDHLKFCLTI